jgi:hypothetical protein
MPEMIGTGMKTDLLFKNNALLSVKYPALATQE